ncbi:MAG: class I SAM-dependent rRNA methyltransferase [Deltaproteobacteria bacterium]|nr:class I SAM-dependent rRNA methyltransferase [Deltaproteobacteria bacterium]
MRVVLKPGRDFSVRAGHPWVFSGAIARVENADVPGRPAQVCAADGRVLGWGTWHPATSIAVRMMTRGVRPIDAALVRERIARALALRTLVGDTDAVRLVNGEGDGFPGLVVDRYAEFVVCQFLTAGADALRDDVVAALAASTPARGIFERSEGNVRTAEGLARRVGVLYGEEPPPEVVIVECGRRHVVDVRGGQKTGFFLDQRPNRDLVERLAAGRRVLNLFAYSGGFSIAAARGGAAHVASVDSSAAALALAEAAWRFNGLAEALGTFVRADVFDHLRDDRVFGGAAPPPDLVVLDPPPFARRRSDRERARAGYRDVNLRALRVAAPDALLLTFSCSQHVAVEEWEGVVAAAAMDAGRACQLLARLGPGIDHPQALAHAEGRYLKGLLLRVE